MREVPRHKATSRGCQWLWFGLAHGAWFGLLLRLMPCIRGDERVDRRVDAAMRPHCVDGLVQDA